MLIIAHYSLYPMQLCDKTVVAQNLNNTSKTKQVKRITRIP